jgi:hypothetical protein
MISLYSHFRYSEAFRVSLAWLTCACSIALTACSTDDDREELPDWHDGYENIPDGGIPTGDPDGGDVPSKGFPENSFGIAITSSITYPIRLHILDTKKTPCAVAQGASKPDISCILEMDELDLFYLGLRFNIVAPEGMCDFVRYDSFMFENFKIGQGPKEVSWTVQESGNITDSINSAGGKPRCDFDYSWQYAESEKAPNCCYGSYIKRVTDAKTGKVEVSDEVWNGKLADCYHGGAYLDKSAVFTPEGWPMSRFLYPDGESLDHTVQYRGLSDKYPKTTALLANYHFPADRDQESSSRVIKGAVNSHYEVFCLDDAKEVIARVRLAVREWNEEAQFDMEGDPDTEGLEPGWSWEEPINDMVDWGDYERNNIVYPQILPAGKP